MALWCCAVVSRLRGTLSAPAGRASRKTSVAAYQDFLQTMQAHGVRLLTAQQAQAELVANA